MGKHTQGPWIAKGSEINTVVWIEDSNGKRIATVKACEQDWDNTKLMASAPEMLEALKQINEWVSINFPEHGGKYENGSCPTFNKVRSAILKATK